MYMCREEMLISIGLKKLDIAVPLIPRSPAVLSFVSTGQLDLSNLNKGLGRNMSVSYVFTISSLVVKHNWHAHWRL